MRLKTRPLLEPENYNRDFAASEILLIPHVLIRGQQHVEALGFCRLKQLTILEPVPALLRCCTNLMSF